jgi:hypothetical protein
VRLVGAMSTMIDGISVSLKASLDWNTDVTVERMIKFICVICLRGCVGVGFGSV